MEEAVTTPDNAEARPARDASHDARLIDDLRAWRARVDERGPEPERWTARLTLDELDALLTAADDRDRLAREACAEPEPPRALTDDSGVEYRICFTCRMAIWRVPGQYSVRWPNCASPSSVMK